ncbi:hypothetical protein LINGRAHAP2_LOCUS29206 [Linum grandiflorum]
MAKIPITPPPADLLMSAPNRGRLTTEGHHQRTVAEQIAELTIADPLPLLVLTDLVTKPPPWGYELCLVGAFSTKRVMHVHVVCRSLPSVWEPERGVEVDELDGGLYLFQFEHQLDVRKVVDKGSWHFNGVLLIVHELQPGKFQDQVPLTQIPFWVQVHQLPFGYFS